MNAEGRQVFHRAAIIAWARDIGISSVTALRFMDRAGVIIIDDSEIIRPADTRDDKYGALPSR